MCLDHIATSGKELDTVEVLKAIQKAKEVKFHLNNLERKVGLLGSGRGGEEGADWVDRPHAPL